MRTTALPLSAVAIAALVLTLVTPAAAQAADDGTFSVSGHVTVADPGAVISVSVYDEDGDDIADTDDSDDAYVGDNGDYTIAGIPPGEYTVQFSDIRDDQDDAYLSQFYGGVVTDDLSDDGVDFFDVTDADVTGIDGSLALVPFSETTAPAITGTRVFGKTLSVDTGDWLEEPDFEYQWYRGSTAITDATDDSYTIAAADLGKKISVDITASEPGYIDWEKRSAAVAIPLGTKVKAVKPTITGTARTGKTLKAVTGSWKPGKLTFTYQWNVGGKAIPKATKSKLTVKRAFAGKKITVVVTGGKVGVGAATKTSKPVRVAR